MAVFLMSDLDLPLRDRTYREPEGPHVLLVRGRELDDALEHLDSRPDCRALGIIGPVPGDVPDLALLQGRRLLVCCEDGSRLRDLAEAGMNAGAEVEWLRTDKPDFDRLAAWALPVAGVVLAAGAASRMGSNKLLLDAGGQPLVGARTIEVILRAWRREGARPAVATSYNGRREDWRPPVLLDRSLWPELMTLEGDAGARQLLEKRPELVDTVHSTGRPDDVDTPEDYAKIVHLFPGERSH